MTEERAPSAGNSRLLLAVATFRAMTMRLCAPAVLSPVNASTYVEPTGHYLQELLAMAGGARSDGTGLPICADRESTIGSETTTVHRGS
jgi:hypothetical protein